MKRVENNWTGRLADVDPWLTAGSVAAGIAAGVVAGCCVHSVVTFLSWRHKLRDVNTNKAAVGPTPVPLLGNILRLRKEYYKTLYEYVDRPASVFWILSTPFVVVNNIEDLQRVLGGARGLYTKPKYFGYRSKPVQAAVEIQKKKVVNESVDYFEQGDASRIALQKMVSNNFETIKQSMKALLQSLEAAAESDVEPTREIRKSIVGLNLEILFGLRAEHREPENMRIADMIEYAGTEFARRMVNPLKIFADLIANVRYLLDVMNLISVGRMLCRTLDNVSKASAGPTWVHAWVGKVGKIGKLGKVVGLLMASSQTVPLTSAWMLFLLGRNPDVVTALRKELNDLNVHNLGDLRESHLPNMVLADAVIKETLRLYPPFPLIQREAQADDVLGGISVPRGTIVYVVPWLVHRNPKYWDSPHDFRPNRFLQNSSHGDAPSDWAYLPFGRGSRMCAGSRLAMSELKTLLAGAVLDYNINADKSAESASDIFPQLGVIPNGVILALQRRC